jgi:hypothetical protein
MPTLTFPLSRNAAENKIKRDAGYVEYVAFADQRGGYFCGTCPAFRQYVGQVGFCAGLKVPVVSYGCCNNWRLAPRASWIGADGFPL